MKPSFSVMSSGRSDRTLQCALPALLEDIAAFKQSFDLQTATASMKTDMQ